MTTQKQWHGSPGGTLTITSSLSQSLRWLMKRKSKGQLCIQARRPHHHLLWREQDGSRRWNAEGDLSKALGMAFHWYLARKRVNMSLLILVWRSNCRNIRKEYGNLVYDNIINWGKRVLAWSTDGITTNISKCWGLVRKFFYFYKHIHRVTIERTYPYNYKYF